MFLKNQSIFNLNIQVLDAFHFLQRFVVNDQSIIGCLWNMPSSKNYVFGSHLNSIYSFIMSFNHFVKLVRYSFTFSRQSARFLPDIERRMSSVKKLTSEYFIEQILYNTNRSEHWGTPNSTFLTLKKHRWSPFLEIATILLVDVLHLSCLMFILFLMHFV
jgi:hypothetical protein